MGMLSVCMIAKNEEKNIGRCLERLKAPGAELIVVDTGSADRTKEIARRYTDHVYDFAWCDDFAAAKNDAISRASNDCVLVLDCDEFVEDFHPEEIVRQADTHPGQVGRIKRRNVFTRDGQQHENREWINRVFDRRLFHYEGRIHEQVVPIGGHADEECSYGTYQTAVTVLHTGYDLTEKERIAKAERNKRLLLEELAKEPNPYLFYQLGKSCYMEAEYADACDYFAKGLSYDLDPQLEYVIDMVETYGYAMLNAGRAQDALSYENIYDAFGNSADFQFLMGLIYMNNERFDDAVREFQKATTHADARSVGANSYAAYYNIGVIYECLGRREDAVRYYRKCGSYQPAMQRLAGLLEGEA